MPQGAPEAPLVFALIFEAALKTARHFPGTVVLPTRRGGPGQPMSVTTLAYADHVLLMCKNRQEAQIMLHRLEQALATIHLQLNASKCQLIALRHACRVPRNISEQLATLTGATIPPSDEIEYLGVVLTAQGAIKYKTHQDEDGSQ